MSFTINQTGIENFAESIQLIFPHPPIIEERFTDSKVDHLVEWSIKKTAVTVQYEGSQDLQWLRLFVRRMTAAQMATLAELRDETGLMNVKLAAGSATTILCAFGPEDEQEWTPMINDHPETTEDGSAIPTLLKVYEAHVALVRMD